MALPALLKSLRLPVIGSPMFIVSHPALVIAQCQAGIVGSMPALNARPPEQLEDWLAEITETLRAYDLAHPERPAAPFAINQIVHKTNSRLERDMAICEKFKVPLVISSLGARPDVNEAVHAWGGLVLHDVIHNEYAHKAIDKGADGLIAVAAGAGGHASNKSPFALVQEIRSWFDGPLALAGSIATGDGILAALAMGADLAYIGSAFIATTEARASQEYKDMIVRGTSDDIVYTPLFTGVNGNYLKDSIRQQGMDPDHLPDRPPEAMDFSAPTAKAWKEIWGAGQGIGAIHAIESTADRVARWELEFQRARQRLGLSCAVASSTGSEAQPG